MAAVHETRRSPEEQSPANSAAEDPRPERVTERTIILVVVVAFAVVQAALFLWLVR